MEIKTTKINKNGSMEKYITTSVMVSENFYKLCKQYNIKFVDAMRTGISILLAEKGEMDYDNKLNVWRKMQYFRKQAEESLQKINQLMDRTSPTTPITTETHQQSKKTKKP
jgi:hypothetical protein